MRYARTLIWLIAGPSQGLPALLQVCVRSTRDRSGGGLRLGRDETPVTPGLSLALDYLDDTNDQQGSPVFSRAGV